MFNFLDKIRQKPEPQRRFYAIIITCLLMGFIMSIWISVITTKGINNSESANSSKSETVENQSQKNSPFASLKKSFGRFYGEAKTLWGNLYEAGTRIKKESENKTKE